MGREKGSDTKGEKEKQRRQRVRRYLCLTDQNRGRKIIIVGGKPKIYQSLKKGSGGMIKIASSKENKYIRKPMMVEKRQIRGTGRLKDTISDLSECILHKLKTKCLMERCEGGRLSC